LNKQYIKEKYYALDSEATWNKWKYNINKKLKKFKKSKKKRFFIRYKYPHRKSIAHYKSYVTLKRYLLKHRLWYTAKRGCLRFFDFEKNQPIVEVEQSKEFKSIFLDDNERNKFF